MKLPSEDLWLPLLFLIGVAVYTFVRRPVGWADTKYYERVFDVIFFITLVVVAVQTRSEFIRISIAIAAALLLVGWLVASRRRK